MASGPVPPSAGDARDGRPSGAAALPASLQGQPLGTVTEVHVLSGTRIGEQLLFFDTERVRIGRNPANDVVIPEGGVSRHHAELLAERDVFKLVDLGSTAGTFLVGGAGAQRVEPTSPTPLPCPGSYELSFGRGGPRCRISLGLSVPFGRYRLIARLGGGGMAEVYLARQTGLGGFSRSVAIKLIQPEMFDIVDASAMFLDEARIAAEINHHNVVKIYDVGEENGVLFLAMEYLRGTTLSHMTAQLAQRGERMPPDLVASLVSQACSGLHAAHTLRDPAGRPLNVVHRDVSPSNLMVTSEGLVKVIDFGVARADRRLVRKEEGLQGKPAYMSPEQIQGLPLDGRSDVFAVGVVLYELCSGRPLFQRDDMVSTFYAVVRGEIAPLRSVCPQASPLLEMVVHKALAKDPTQRFQSAADLGAELDQVVQEAGGRFANISAVARFVAEWGISLTGSPPALLTQVPKPLLHRPPRGHKGSLDESLSLPPLDAVVDGRVEPEKRRLDATLEPAQTPLAAPRPVSARHSPVPSSHQPLLRQPQRLDGVILEGRYRIRRWVGHTQESERPYPKLYYLAEIMREEEPEKLARATGILENKDVLIMVCGRGPEVAALSSVQRDRLRAFAAQRSVGQVTPHLMPVLHLGELPTLGSSYLVLPQLRNSLQAVVDPGPLPPADEAMTLIHELVQGMLEAEASQPGFVHGNLSLASFGLYIPRGAAAVESRPPPSSASPTPAPIPQVPPTPAPIALPSVAHPIEVIAARPHVVLNDFHLESLLGSPDAPFSERQTLPVGDTQYWPPERVTGGPVSQAGDVYALGAIIYQLLGGDLAKATQAARARRELPRLPVHVGVPAHVEAAVLSAMRPDPATRPSLQALAAGLQPQTAADSSPAPSIGEGVLRIALPLSPVVATADAPPRPSPPQTLRGPGGRELKLSLVALHAPKQHVVLPLPFSSVPELLPAALLLKLHGQTLMVELDASDPAIGRGRDRHSVYYDAYDPNTRCESYTLLPSTPVASFDVGHRRTRVQRIHYASVIAAGPGAAERLALTVPELQIEFSVAGPLLRLCVLHTSPSGSDAAATHVFVILIAP